MREAVGGIQCVGKMTQCSNLGPDADSRGCGKYSGKLYVNLQPAREIRAKKRHKGEGNVQQSIEILQLVAVRSSGSVSILSNALGLNSAQTCMNPRTRISH